MTLLELKMWINEIPAEQLTYDLVAMIMDDEESTQYKLFTPILGMNEDNEIDGTLIFTLDKDFSW
jgi:hypothetical protein